MLILYLLGAVCIWRLLSVLHRRWKYDLHKIPSPPGLPILGNTMEMLRGRDSTQVRGKWHKSLGEPKIFKVRLFGKDVVHITDKECLLNQVLSNRNPLPRAQEISHIMIKMFGGDKNNKPFATRPVKTEYVHRLRTAYLKSFTTKNMKKFIPKMNDVLDRMVEIIESKRSEGPIDFQRLCVKLTLDTIGVIALERNNGGLDDTGTLYRRLLDFGHMITIWSYNPFENLYCFLFPNSSLAKSQRSVVDLLTAEWDRIVDEILQRDPPSDGTEPLWYSFRSTINPDTGKPLERNLLRAELANAVVGGMDATGHQLGWILGLLSKHPEVQEKLYEEVKDLEMRTVDLGSLTEMPYLSAVVKEGMRIANAATAAFMTKKTESDMTLLGYRIPKNTLIFVPTNRWMDTEEDWGDPLAFRPERWTNNEVNPKNFYFGFSAGPRYCPGRQLALVEMKLALVKLTQNYIFTSDKEYMDMMTDTVNGFVIEAKGGMMLEIEPRSGIF